MKAYVFSIGENTTDLCCDLMSEYGFEVVLYKDQTTLWEKLKRFYTEALETHEDRFVRIDADIIPNRNTETLLNVYPSKKIRWWCASGFDWYKFDSGAISIHFMDRKIIELCLKHIDEAQNEIRPETYLWRLNKINKYTALTSSTYGVHGYGQANQRNRIKELKSSRNQSYDWDLIERIEKL